MRSTLLGWLKICWQTIIRYNSHYILCTNKASSTAEMFYSCSRYCRMPLPSCRFMSDKAECILQHCVSKMADWEHNGSNSRFPIGIWAVQHDLVCRKCATNYKQGNGWRSNQTSIKLVTVSTGLNSFLPLHLAKRFQKFSCELTSVRAPHTYFCYEHENPPTSEIHLIPSRLSEVLTRIFTPKVNENETPRVHMTLINKYPNNHYSLLSTLICPQNEYVAR